MTYWHLKAQDRYQIDELKVQGFSQRKIAELMRRSASTIFREIKRNTGDRGYRPKQAELKTQSRLHVARGGGKEEQAETRNCISLIKKVPALSKQAEGSSGWVCLPSVMSGSILKSTGRSPEAKHYEIS